MVTLTVCFNFNLFDKHIQLGIMSTFKENWTHKKLDWKKNMKKKQTWKQTKTRNSKQSIMWLNPWNMSPTSLLSLVCFFLPIFIFPTHRTCYNWWYLTFFKVPKKFIEINCFLLYQYICLTCGWSVLEYLRASIFISKLLNQSLY